MSVKSVKSVPYALQAWPAKLKLAVRPVSLVFTLLALYPGHAERSAASVLCRDSNAGTGLAETREEMTRAAPSVPLRKVAISAAAMVRRCKLGRRRDGGESKQTKQTVVKKVSYRSCGRLRCSREGRERSLYCPRTTQEDVTIHDPLLLHTLQESRERCVVISRSLEGKKFCLSPIAGLKSLLDR